MVRLNLTLDDHTARALAKHAKRARTPQATLARRLLADALAVEEARARRLSLARDYSRGRRDAAEVLRDLEAAQLDGLDDER